MENGNNHAADTNSQKLKRCDRVTSLLAGAGTLLALCGLASVLIA